MPQDSIANLTDFLINLLSMDHAVFVLKVVLIVAVLIPVISLVIDFLDFRRLQKLPMALLELTPPSSGAKSAHANSQLFAVLYGLYGVNSWRDELLRHKQTIAFEVVSTRDKGIRYLVRVP